VASLWSFAGKAAHQIKKAIEAYNNGLKQYTLHNYKSAEDLFLSAIAADDKFVDAYLMLGQVYEDSNQSLKAIDAYQTALNMDESYYPFGYMRLGNLQYREGQYDKAKSSTAGTVAQNLH